jgi:hypothetical protein
MGSITQAELFRLRGIVNRGVLNVNKTSPKNAVGRDQGLGEILAGKIK